MTLTLLLDLDDTLLTNRIDTFLSTYLEAWGKFIADRVQPDLFVQQLLVSTQKMLKNDRPDRTLKEVFDAAFYPAIGVPEEELRETIDRFYREVYPGLRTKTQPRAEAVRLVEQALGRGCRLAVATNPLFPLPAIIQRLEWAGLPVDQFPFELISSYETFHYAKPNPAYFGELLAQMGWPVEPPVMVGNSLEDDVRPAIRVGIQAYLLLDPDNPAVAGTEEIQHKGTLSEIFSWLETIREEDIQPDYSLSSSMVATLKGSPAALATLTRSVPVDRWNIRPQPEEWSLTEIICHLRDAEREVNLPRMEKIASDQNPFLPGMDTDPWAEERNYIQQDGVQALHDFIDARSQVLDRLRSFQEVDWERPTRHAIFGPTPVRELIGFIATHDRTHVHQVHQTIRTVRVSS